MQYFGYLFEIFKHAIENYSREIVGQCSDLLGGTSQNLLIIM
jgi:hypothetical protein